MNFFKRFCVWGALILVWGCAPASDSHMATRMVSEPVVAESFLQVRKTSPAPPAVRDRINSLELTDENIRAGQRLFQTAKPLACKLCHGEQGDGKGDPGFESIPPARNFTCAPTMNVLSDGQLFWIIRNGSPDTSMLAFSELSEEDVWRLVHYLREFSKK